MRTWSGHVAIHSLSLGKNKVVPRSAVAWREERVSLYDQQSASMCCFVADCYLARHGTSPASRKLNQGHLGASALRVPVLLNADFHFAPIKDAQRHIVVKR